MSEAHAEPERRTSNWNVPNALTTLRIVMVPFFGYALLVDGGQSMTWRWVAYVLFVVAMITDKVDGDLARKHNLVTDFGKIADPIADKALIGAALICLSLLHELWWWVTAVILVREIGITVFRFIALRDRVIAASWLGKLKTVGQAVAISFALFPFWQLVGHWVNWVNAVLIVLALVLTVVSGIEYLWQAWKVGRAKRIELPE